MLFDFFGGLSIMKPKSFTSDLYEQQLFVNRELPALKYILTILAILTLTTI